MADAQDDASLPRAKRACDGAARYGTKYKQQWEAEFPFVSRSMQCETSFFCRVCCKDVSCRHQGKADVRRHEKSSEHHAKARSSAGTSRLQDIGFVPVGTPLDTQVYFIII